MIARLKLSNEQIAGMIQLVIFVPVRIIEPPDTGMRKLDPKKVMFHPTSIFPDNWPPWSGWLHNSGNRVFGEASWGHPNELIVEWTSGESHYIEMRSNKELKKGMKLAFKRIRLPKVFNERAPPEFNLKVMEMVVL